MRCLARSIRVYRERHTRTYAAVGPYQSRGRIIFHLPESAYSSPMDLIGADCEYET